MPKYNNKNFEKTIEAPSAFPDPLASDAEKSEESYGLQWGRAIQWEWFSRSGYSTYSEGVTDGSTSRYYDKRYLYHLNRLYARGEQPTDFYKNFFGIDTSAIDNQGTAASELGDTTGGQRSFTNYNWSPLKIIPAIRRLIVRQNSERFFNIRAEATDKYSTDLRDDYKKYLENLMFSKSMLEDANNLLGIDMLSNADTATPESQEEIELHMKLNYKSNVEVATEEAIKFTFDINDFEEEQLKMLESVFDNGVCFGKHYTDPTRGIVLEWADEADMVYSYPKDKDFRNVYYYGQVDRITIGELKRMSGNRFTNEQLRDMAMASADWTSYHNLTNTLYYDYDDFDYYMVNIMHFTFQAQNTIVHKKKNMKNGGFKMERKDENFPDLTSEKDDNEVDRKIIDVWYKGTMILGTDYIFNYGLCENLVRPEDYINKTIPPYIAYAPETYQNRFRSLILDMRDYVDQMQMIHLKMQAEVAKARVPGAMIDVAGLNDVSLGDGNALDPITQLRIYDDTGNVLWSSVNQHGDQNFNKAPIIPLPNGLSATFQNYIVAYNHYLGLLRESIGVPVGAGVSDVDPRLAVGVQEQLTVSSNTATRHVLDSVLHVTKIMGNAVYLRMKDIFMYSGLKKVYMNALGKINVDLLESLENYHLHYLGIDIQLKPDAQEKALLEQNIQQALAKETIILPDAIDIRQISNIKLANQLLIIRIEKRRKQNEEAELEKIRVNNEGAAAAAERTAQANMQQIQAEAQSKLMVVNAETDGKIKVLAAEEQSKARLMDREFQYNAYLKGVEVDGKFSVDRMKEDEKLKRQNINNTQASQMIKQRETNGPPVNFESSQDSLTGGIELGEV